MADTDLIYTILAIVIPIGELLGIIAAVHAVMNARTSQGAIAWAISLVTFPWLALALYAIFGRNKFNGYVSLRGSRIRISIITSRILGLRPLIKT